MIRIAFVGHRPGLPVIPLAYACGVGSTHDYPHRFDAIDAVCAARRDRWEAAAVESADLVVYPHRYEPCESAREAETVARDNGLPCIFFEHGDHPGDEPPQYGTLYRTELEASRRPRAVRAMSGLSDDMLADRNGTVLVRERIDVPSVGFCGNTGSRRHDVHMALRGRWHVAAASQLRRRAMRSLERTDGVQTRFIRHNEYWGGAIRRVRQRAELADSDLRRTLREQFIGNILDTDYTLCVRGAGNYSIRFYEVLSAGRIPLFIDSDCVLPFEDRIDWRSHCVWVDQARVGDAGVILREFHGRLTPDSFREMQLRNRALWEGWLAPVAFYDRVIADALAGAPASEGMAAAGS